MNIDSLGILLSRPRSSGIECRQLHTSHTSVIRSSRTSIFRIILDCFACESSQVWRCGISTSSSGLGGADQKRKQEMTNFTRVNLKAWANTKSPMWRRKWRIEHWSCSHSDDSIWQICCIYVTRHTMSCCRRMLLLQSRHFNSLTAKSDSCIRRKARPSRSQISTHYLTYARRKSKLHA
jgi:hypothetical protein